MVYCGGNLRESSLFIFSSLLFHIIYPVRKAISKWYLPTELLLLSGQTVVELCSCTDRRKVSRPGGRFRTQQLIYIPFQGS